MADTSGLLKIGLIGGAAWLGYELFLKPSTSAAAASPAGAAPTQAAAPTGAPATGYNSTDQIYQRLVQAITQGNSNFAKSPSSFTATPYDYLYYLNQVTQVPAGLDFSKLFPSQVNSDGSLSQNPNVTLGQFWSVVSGWLQKNLGLGRLGLAGLIAGRARR